MKRVLLNQGFAPAVASLLRDEGWDAVHVLEIGMHCAQDAEVLDEARNSNRACVTLDHDFHTHLAVARSGRPSVVLLRIQGLGAAAQTALIRAIWQTCELALSDGAAVFAD